MMIALQSKLYESYGFEVKEVRTQLLSGQELTEERWELDLRPG